MTDKGKFLIKFNEAFADSDIAFLSDNVTDDLVWTIVGDKTISGKAAFIKDLEAMASKTSYRLEISSIITHGKNAAVDGTMKRVEKGTVQEVYAFCDVYEFSGFKNPKIKAMTSYVIELKN